MEYGGLSYIGRGPGETQVPDLHGASVLVLIFHTEGVTRLSG